MPIEISITIPNLPDMVWAFSQDITPEITTEFGSKLVPELLMKMREEAPRKTGALAEKLYTQSEGPLAWGFYESGETPYGAFVREGTDKHAIPPRRPAYALWWQDIKVGHPIPIAYQGISNKNPYHLRALEAIIPVFEETLGSLFMRIGQRWKF